MPVPTELSHIEDAVIVEVRRAYPEDVTNSALEDLNVGEPEEMRQVLSALMADGVIKDGEDGYVYVDPTDVEDLPIPPEAESTPGAAGRLSEQPGEPEAAPGPEASPATGEPTRRFEASLGMRVAFPMASAEDAVTLARELGDHLRDLLAESTSADIEVLVVLEKVEMYENPQTVFSAE